MAVDAKRVERSHFGPSPTSPSATVRLLAHQQRPLLVRHLERLPAESRRLRFGAPFGDEMIARYVDGIDFHRDRVFGVYSLDRRLIGMAHLALDPTQWFAEIGLSVEPAHRDRGYGHALLQHAIRHAASAGYRTLFMQCLAENEIIKHIAQKSGLEVVTAHGEANAHIALSQEADGVQSANALDGPPVLIDSVFKRPLASQQILHTASESS